MNKKELLQSLRFYGFTDNESVIFLSLLEILEGTVTDIAKRANLPRSTVQSVIEKLREKGFVESFRKNKILNYTTVSLNKLITDLREKEEIIEKTLPSLRQIVNAAKSESSIQAIYGLSNIKAIFTDMLDMYRGGLRNVYAISNLSKLEEALPRFFPAWALKEAVYPVDIQMLVPEESVVHPHTLKNPRMSIKRIPQEYSFPGDMTIIGSKVIFFHLDKKNPHAFIIDSQEVADMQKSIFGFLWDCSREDTLDG
ncbi:helix-turn-helix domain-containing protein [Candidatus Nomurabacteria bacterium]|nr:helix-turn-helix domain-containing protein [Candidatus Nomurabacteria bacterium]